MGISKKIYEHSISYCIDCQTQCDKSSESVAICMDTKEGTGTYNQDHLKSMKSYNKKGN